MLREYVSTYFLITSLYDGISDSKRLSRIVLRREKSLLEYSIKEKIKTS